MSGMPRRSGVNKRRSAGKFRRDTGKTHALNMRFAPRRGGWRL